MLLLPADLRAWLPEGHLRQRWTFDGRCMRGTAELQPPYAPR